MNDRLIDRCWLRKWRNKHQRRQILSVLRKTTNCFGGDLRKVKLQTVDGNLRRCLEVICFFHWPRVITRVLGLAQGWRNTHPDGGITGAKRGQGRCSLQHSTLSKEERAELEATLESHAGGAHAVLNNLGAILGSSKKKDMIRDFFFLKEFIWHIRRNMAFYMLMCVI